jgi:NAD(P)H-dependent flavin oxidoreductase YrpB (nitropropane dioxygenase family)
MGTRFVAAQESGAHRAYRRAVIEASGADSVLTDVFSLDWPGNERYARVLRGAVEAAQAFDGDVVGEASMGPETFPVERFSPMPPMVTTTGTVEAMALYAGESARFVGAEEPAAAIVRAVATGAEQFLAAWR